jgi:hypothetical protein
MSFVSCREYNRRAVIFPWEREAASQENRAAAGARQAPQRATFYTLKRFDPFSPMCIVLIDGKEN